MLIIRMARVIFPDQANYKPDRKPAAPLLKK
jgi:hypothetical protein